ncbi:DUF5050 domain-containing protein [Bacillus sp. JJ722]|uniref:DUF5050 domain-containing protein n=1 Tax=Bacillus sp. JJ722 TaxID=3122973 RepID=UPI002FFFA7C4
MKKRIGVLLVAVMMLISVIPSFTYAAEVKGNSASNSVNYGYITEDKGWYYFRDGNDIYKMRTNGKEKKLLVKGLISPSHLSVVGSYLYYADLEGPKDSDVISIYRVSLDGKVKNVIAKNTSDEYYILDNSIYYLQAKSANPDHGYYLSKMNLDGNKKVRLLNTTVDSFTTDGTNIYYSLNELLYRTSLDGKGAVKVMSDKAWEVIVADGWIYYKNVNDGLKLYKITTNGKNKTRLTTKAVGAFHVDRSTILYNHYDYTNFEGTALYIMSTNGKNVKKLSNKPMDYIIYKLGDKIVYDFYNEKDEKNYFYMSTYKNGKLGSGNLIFKILEP